jgi:hypothetical protein
MSVAPETISLPIPSGRLRPPLSRRLEHLFVALGICLPIPVFAATGLSVPLPTTVERLAAALVPWANASATAEPEPVAGKIVRAPGERPVGSAPGRDSAVMNVRDEQAPFAAGGTKQAKNGPSGKGDGGGASGDGGGASGVDGSGGSGNTSGPGGAGGTSGGSTSGTGGGELDSGSPVQGVVDTVTETTDPALDDVGGIVNDAGGTLDGVLQGANDTLTGPLSGK